NLIGLKAAVSVEIEVYQGKEKSRVVEVFPLEDLVEDDEEDEDDDEDYEVDDDEDDEDDEDDDDEDDEDEDDEDDEDEDEEVEVSNEEELEEMDDDELLSVAEEFEVKPVYKGKGKRKKLDRAKTIEAILEASEEE